LAQAPWSFKFLWSPLMDRYSSGLGRKRGWILITQAVLLALGLWLGAVADHPEAAALIGALALATAFASASQDIAYDGYTVEVLRKEEHGLAVGTRNALGRLALFVSGRVSITAAATLGWPLVHGLLALCYLPAMLVTWFAPEPETAPEPPQSLRDAVFGPFLGLLGQHRALEILAFVVLYKLSDNLTQALTSSFLVQVGFNDVDVGVSVGAISLFAFVGGAFVGGILTQRMGLGHALWLCGLLQIFSNLGYAVVAEVGVDRPVMFAAVAFEMGTSGMGTGAFGVFLLRLTQKRFSATQFALLSSLFAIPRVVSGPIAGVMADSIGWRDFYIFTVVTGLPGMLMLHRFAPWGVKEPALHVEEPARGEPLSRRGLAWRAGLAGIVGVAIAGLSSALLAALRGRRAGHGFHFGAALQTLTAPVQTADWVTSAGVLIIGLVVALAAAATLAARWGIKEPARA
jgi:PAT family beta-lactamase induction signal transducer AmpG